MSVALPPFTPPTHPATVIEQQLPHWAKAVDVQSHGYHYTVTGNTLLSPATIRNCLLSAKDPKEAITALVAAYRQAGHFLTAVTATPNGKNISISVFEGEITEDHIPDGLHWFFDGVNHRRAITYNDVLRRTLLAESYAARNGQHMQIGFSPAPQPGGSALNVGVSPTSGYFPISGNLIFGNYGSRYASRYLTGGNLSIHPGWGLELNTNFMAGLTGLTPSTTGSQYDTGGVGISSITPWGTYGFNTQWTRYRLGVYGALDNVGKVHTYTFTGSQLLYASDHSRLSSNEAFTHVSNVISYLGGAFVLTDQKYDYYSLGLAYSRGYTVLGRGGSTTLNVTYNQGISGLRGSFASYSGKGNPTPNFRYLNFGLTAQQGLPYGFTAQLNASGQWSPNTLPQQQQWVLGGFGSLSAWYPGILAGDSGYLGRFALQTPSWQHFGISTSGSLFFEAGGVTNAVLFPGTPPWQSLSDVGLGINIHTRFGTTISAMAALPVGWNGVPAALREGNRNTAYFVLQQEF
ncbi:MAG: ShlB/FhaC/HecB family hemolysin secretion/activation protein [Acidithiobacillus sp.]